MKVIIIRRATIADSELLSAFQIAMAHETESLVLQPAKVKEGVEKVLNDNGIGSYYLAEYSGKVCGCCLTLYEWSDWRNAQVIWIHSVYVAPEFRQKGIFKALYRHIKALVVGNDAYAGIRLYVDKSNVKAASVYRKAGMDDKHYSLFEWLK